MKTIEISEPEMQRVLSLLRVTKNSLGEMRDSMPDEMLASMTETFDVLTASYADELAQNIKLLERAVNDRAMSGQ
jgi:hypothetical protein